MSEREFVMSDNLADYAAALPSSEITAEQILSALGISTLSGSNTGDQDLSGLVAKVAGKGLSTNDYTTAEQTKLAGIASGATVGADWNTNVTNKPTIPAAQVQTDWNASSGMGQLLNKPTISGSNTGDETTSTIKTKLGISTLSGSNTGDQTITLTGDVTGSGTGSFVTTFKSSPSFTTPVIGAATGTSLAVTGALTSSGTAGIGYASGAGGTQSQSSSKSTGVTLNKTCGTITMNSASLASQTTVSFTLTNSTIGANDFVDVQHASVGTLGAYTFAVAPASGSVVISVRNVTASTLSEAIVLRYIVIKSATS